MRREEERWVPGVWGGRRGGEVVFNEGAVSVWEDGRFWRQTMMMAAQQGE